MAYYLMIKDKDGYKNIDISKHNFFERCSNFKGDRFSLEDIDNFTSSFGDEITFRESLFYNGIIDEKEIFKEISIRRKNNDKYDKVMYDPVYKDGKKYFDIEYLIYKIKMLGSNASFIDRLLSHYRNSYINNETIANIRAALLGNPEIDLYRQLDKFVKREVYNIEFSKEKNTYVVTGIKYKSLHDLAMFVYNFENKNILTREEKNSQLKEFISFMEKDKKDIKRRVKKNINLEGQMSFFE